MAEKNSTGAFQSLDLDAINRAIESALIAKSPAWYELDPARGVLLWGKGAANILEENGVKVGRLRRASRNTSPALYNALKDIFEGVAEFTRRG